MIIRCKSCGKNIQYDIALGKLHCSQCGSDFRPEDYPDSSPTFDACSYTCQSCGAELITTDDTEATAFCSYCGSTSILAGRMEKIKKPDAILPFRITREKCREIYLKQAKKTFMAPGWLRSEQCVNSFRAIYMPYWSYKVKASGYVIKTETTRERDGDDIVETTTEFKSRKIDQNVAAWSHDASKAFADDISEMMDFNQVDESSLMPFHEGYLSGFYADMADDAAKEHRQIAESEMKARLGGLGSQFSGKISLTDHKLNYMPVWFMSTRNGDRITYAAVNGYTGKMVADFPISTRKFLTVAVIAAAILAALLSMVLVLRPEPAFWCSAILTLIGFIFCAKEENRLRDIREATGKPAGREVRLWKGGKITLRMILGAVYIMIFLGVIIANPVGKEAGSWMTVLMIGFFVLALLPRREYSVSKTKTAPRRMVISIVSCIFAGFLLLTRNNIVIYSVVLFYAFVLSTYCISVFHTHQEIAFRRPPQFNRKGANHDA